MRKTELQSRTLTSFLFQELLSLVNSLRAADVGLDLSEALTSSDNNLGHGIPIASGPSSSSNGRDARDRLASAHPSPASSACSEDSPTPSPAPPPLGAPVTYVDVFEHPDLTVGIFIVKEGRSIPLHNHPNMYGVIKCLSGRFDLVSYTHLDPEDEADVLVPEKLLSDQRGLLEQELVFPTKKEVVKGVNSGSACSYLTPGDRNYHELHAVDGPAAFIDILAPPYSTEDDGDDDPERRECDFFKELCVSTGKEKGEKVSWLQWIPPPKDYFCDAEDYRGPGVYGSS